MSTTGVDAAAARTAEVLRELQELMQLVKDKQLQSVPTTCMHFSKAFTALLALEEGKAAGRQILKPTGA